MKRSRARLWGTRLWGTRRGAALLCSALATAALGFAACREATDPPPSVHATPAPAPTSRGAPTPAPNHPRERMAFPADDTPPSPPIGRVQLEPATPDHLTGTRPPIGGPPNNSPPINSQPLGSPRPPPNYGPASERGSERGSVRVERGDGPAKKAKKVRRKAKRDRG